MITTIIVVVVVLVVLWLILSFNGLVRTRNRAREAFSDIDVQLKRRYDLIPNLVEAVKGYMTHEASVFEKVTAARSQAMQATGAAKAGAEDDFIRCAQVAFCGRGKLSRSQGEPELFKFAERAHGHRR